MNETDFLGFTMRAKSPKPGEDWFRIVQNKKGEKAKVYIYDEIGYWGTNAKDFASQLNDLDADEIEVHVNSPGGSVFDGLAIYNSLKQHDAKITTICDGLAASAASFIMQAGDERVIARNAQMMIHDAIALVYGNAADMRQGAELLDKVSDNIADVYAQRAETDAGGFRDLMKEETWYTGQEAKAAGLVDSVLDTTEDEDEDAKNKWDFSAFNYAGRDQAPPPVSALERLSITNRVEEAQMSGNSPATNDDKNTKGPENKNPAPTVPAVQLMVNGAEVSDISAVQAHITALETFQKETIESGRKNFVAELANSNKIAATQVEKMEAFALSLSPEQFSDWKASYDAAPSLPLFDKHGVTGGDQNAPSNGGSVDETSSRIKTLEEIVQSHRASGMSEADVQNKSSYKELQNLKSQVSNS